MTKQEKILDLPDKFEGRFRCIYPTCITNKPREAIVPKFSVISRSPFRLKCDYCGRYIEWDRVEEQINQSASTGES